MFGSLPGNHAAHHIVPSTSPSMSILRKYNIDPNSVSNGVALPRAKKSSSISASHRGRHCKPYYDFVDRIIMGSSGSKEDVVNALSLIRQELLSGAVVLQDCT